MEAVGVLPRYEVQRPGTRRRGGEDGDGAPLPHGMQPGNGVAVGNLLFLTSLRSGWWSAHRAAVLRAVSAAAGSCGIRSLGNILTRGQDRLTKPALRFDDRDDPHILSRVNARPSTIVSHDFKEPSRGVSIPRVPELSQVGDVKKVKMAISRVIHYLMGNLQLVELVGVDFYDEMGLALKNVSAPRDHLETLYAV